MSEPLDPRVAELLSARLDDAVTPEERDLADRWLAASEAARAEDASLAAVRAAVRGLPPVEPPPGFYDGLLRHGLPGGGRVVALAGRRGWRSSAAMVAASGVATAAAWVLVAGGAGTGAFRPPIEGVAAAAVAAPVPGSSGDDAPVERLGRMELLRSMPTRGAEEATAVLGDRAGAQVAVLRQDGEVDWGELPRGERGTAGEAVTWIDLTSGPRVARVVVVRDGAVYTLASADVDAVTLVELAATLPGGDGADDDDGAWDRVRRACDSLVEALDPAR